MAYQEENWAELIRRCCELIGEEPEAEAAPEARQLGLWEAPGSFAAYPLELAF
jgi:hypothetical protein